MGEEDRPTREGEEFRGLDLSRSALPWSELYGCSFIECDFTEADASGRRFEGCRFEGCNLSNTVIAHARFIDPVFESCKLAGLAFYRCDQSVFDFNFRSCKLIGCNFGGLSMKKSVFKDCAAKDCSFQDAFLEASDFSGTDLAGSLFHNTDLRRAVLSGARNYAIDPRVNRIEKALFSYPEAMALVECFGIRIE